MKSPDNTNPESWHRFFAASANNVAWDFAELSAAEVNPRDSLNAAHAAAWHWQQVGTELNRMRALLLLAQAHAQAGLGSTALAYAEEVSPYFLASSTTPDWEIAFTHMVHAYAAYAAGDKDLHARSYERGVEAIARIAGDENRIIAQRVFRHLPAP